TTPVGFDRIKQYREHVRPLPAHFVKDRRRRYQARQPTGFRGAQTQQPDDITGISMKGLAFVRLIYPGVGILTREPEVPYMSKQVPLRVLHPQIATVNPDPNKRNRRLPPG